MPLYRSHRHLLRVNLINSLHECTTNYMKIGQDIQETFCHIHTCRRHNIYTVSLLKQFLRALPIKVAGAHRETRSLSAASRTIIRSEDLDDRQFKQHVFARKSSGSSLYLLANLTLFSKSLSNWIFRRRGSLNCGRLEELLLGTEAL